MDGREGGGAAEKLVCLPVSLMVLQLLASYSFSLLFFLCLSLSPSLSLSRPPRGFLHAGVVKTVCAPGLVQRKHEGGGRGGGGGGGKGGGVESGRTRLARSLLRTLDRNLDLGAVHQR